MLEKVNSPRDIKGFNVKDLENLAAEVRDKLIETVSKNGGHLASNLGTVELTIALHTLFDSPEDKIIFDVGHQAYTHKLLTGRYGKFDTLRKKAGFRAFATGLKASMTF